jgi:hypothetical protein
LLRNRRHLLFPKGQFSQYYQMLRSDAPLTACITA